MTYRAWNLKALDRAALRELTQAIAEQATEELEYNCLLYTSNGRLLPQHRFLHQAASGRDL